MSDCHLTCIQAPKKPSTYLEYGTNQMCQQDFVFYQPQILQSSFLQVWHLRNSSIFSCEALAFHPSLGFCSTWTHFVSIFKGLWKNTQSSLTFLSLYTIPQPFVPLPDGIKIFGGPFCHFHVSNEIPDAKELDQIWATHVGILQEFWTALLCWDPELSRGA